ncbi:MAG: AAA family ATPase [Bacteroidetes bacterium]|nr:AAA family ATPase [Bacteroidota bacterium]
MLSIINTIVSGLCHPDLFDHPVEQFKVLETHSSVVLLTGPFAYKFKRAVNFGFLDYSTLERRHEACLQELQINSRYAPDLYLAVVPVYGTVEAPSLQPQGPVQEYAIKMRQFGQEQLLAVMAQKGQLTPAIAEAIADQMAAFHERAERVVLEADMGTPACVRRWVMENFEALAPLVQTGLQREKLAETQVWMQQKLDALEPLLIQRRRDGFVRDCHGDLHLGNMIWQDDQVLFFDAIEFNEELRWIDVQSELAFAVMDLEDRGLPALANGLLNRYLSRNGDYAGLALFPLFWVYRALVRAKVGLLQRGNSEAALQHLDHLLTLCHRLIHPQPPFLVLMHGLSGSGKSWLAACVSGAFQAIQLRSDVERKRLHGLAAGADSPSQPAAGLYEAGASERTYAHLFALSAQLLEQGFPVVVDAAFLTRAQRAPFLTLARRVANATESNTNNSTVGNTNNSTVGNTENATESNTKIFMLLLVLNVPTEELKRRIAMRREKNGSLSPEKRDPSDADEQVLAWQLNTRELPDSNEAPMLVLDAQWPLRRSAWMERIAKAIDRTIAPG